MEINTSTKKMRDDSNDIRSQADQYNALQKSVFESGRKLDAMWEGDASDRFTARMASDQPKFDELYTVIRSYCQAIDESADDYDQTEAKLQQKMGENTVRKSR